MDADDDGKTAPAFNELYRRSTEEVLVVSHEESSGRFEPDLIKNNQGKIAHFRKLGLYLVYLNNGNYEASEAKVFISYLVWYFAICLCFCLSFGLKEFFKAKDYVDQVDDLIEAAFVGMLLGVIPAFWIYLLREYNTYLPQILMMAKQFENTEVYKKIEFAKEVISTISYKEGWKDEAYNDDIVDVENLATRKPSKKLWWPMKYGPYIGFILSVSICVLLIICSFIWNISIILFDPPSGSVMHLKKELPFFIMTALYPIPYFVSIWFCIFFLEWQRKIHERVRHLIRKIKSEIVANSNGENRQTEKNKKDLREVADALDKAQKVFIILNKRMFQKTIGISFSVYIFLGIFCLWKVVQDASHFCYVVPFSLIIGHCYMICMWSNSLMREFDETIEVLNDMPEDYVQNVINVLNKYPPQVLAFGGFKVNFSMLTAVLAFIISCI
ncbi:unnamed protein product, partial [Meganyctiphanes norvegica]